MEKVIQRRLQNGGHFVTASMYQYIGQDVCISSALCCVCVSLIMFSFTHILQG